ncbi:hypothetical protein Lal_00016805 [Lupinus albus]|nr:hypothetical protein Lal_00016805 [Lupinus albus]
MFQSQQQQQQNEAIWLRNYDLKVLRIKQNDYFTELRKFISKYGNFPNQYHSGLVPMPPPPPSPPAPPVQRHKRILWTEDEHRLFVHGLDVYGKGKWKSISINILPSKTPSQIASHAQKYFLRQSAAEKKRRSIHDNHNNMIMMMEPNHNHNHASIVPIVAQELPHAVATNVEPLNILAPQIYDTVHAATRNAEPLNNLAPQIYDTVHAAARNAEPLNNLAPQIDDTVYAAARNAEPLNNLAPQIDDTVHAAARNAEPMNILAPQIDDTHAAATNAEALDNLAQEIYDIDWEHIGLDFELQRMELEDFGWDMANREEVDMNNNNIFSFRYS